MGQDVVDAFNLQLKGRILTKPKENNAGMGKLEPEYPFAEIPIISDKDTSFRAGKGENFRGKETCGIVFRNSCDIVPSFLR